MGILHLLSPVRAQTCFTSEAGPGVALAPLPDRYHYVFVLDTSGSMMGLGDGKGRVIFPRVKMELKRLAEQLPPDSRVTIQPFDAGPGPSRTFVLPAEKDALFRYVDSLEARGSRTYLYATLLKILEGIGQNRRPNEAYNVYVFTDGQDNDPAPLTIQDVTRRYELQRGVYDWIFYISLGIPAPKDVITSLSKAPNARVLEAPPNQVPSLSEVILRPSALDLGNLWDTREVRRDIQLESRGSVQTIGLGVEAPVLDRAGAFLQVEPSRVPASGTAALTLRLRNADGLAPGTYQAWLCPKAPSETVVRPQGIPLRLAFHPPGAYTLVPVNVPEALQLRPGEKAALTYRLQGNAWAKEPLTVALEAPKGLRASLNGQEGPVTLRPGEELKVAVENTGLGGGSTVRPSLQLTPPPGSTLQSPSALPPVTQPMTWWDWLRRYWWLFLIPLLLLGWLLWRWWQSQRPWGKGTFTTAPDRGCQDVEKPLKGAVDVGRLFGEDRLEGLVLRRHKGKLYLEDVPPEVEVKSGNYRARAREPLEWGEVLKFYDSGKELGSLRIDHK
ncbi:MAG: vWA domain-containing protein [Meiothermus sp.]|uniref:vWA domain-containing protein n=1 Tax=Meiothermus sp. TaxID=1955249 RepID=UPI0028CBE6DC|nr:vWA domain-containing protein [Meiothermus sp.]MDT7920423.1 vWA domain-containing protein [Meiothermus sp.]